MATQTQQQKKLGGNDGGRAVRVAKTIQSGARLLDRAALREFLCMSDDTIARLMDDPDAGFPVPIVFTGGIKQYWTLGSVESYVRRLEEAAQKEHRS